MRSEILPVLVVEQQVVILICLAAPFEDLSILSAELLLLLPVLLR